MLKKIFIALITVYQHTVSPDTGFFRYGYFSGGGACLFSPSCSEYTKRAISEKGVFRGILLGAGRIMRCHPFGKQRSA